VELAADKAIELITRFIDEERCVSFSPDGRWPPAPTAGR
jgi:hypothetical protein